jgi:hypothetical protein
MSRATQRLVVAPVTDAEVEAFGELPTHDQIKLLLSHLGSQVIVFYPRLVDLTLSVPTAVFTGQLIYNTRKVIEIYEANVGVARTSAEWESETTLSRRTVESAINLLTNLKIVEVRRLKSFRSPVYWLNLEELAAQLEQVVKAQYGFLPQITQGDVLLGLLGQTRAFNKALAKVAGDNLNAGLMLSYLMGNFRMRCEREGCPVWIENTIELVENELRLNRNQQEYARRILVARRLIDECVTRTAPPKLRTRLNLSEIARQAVENGLLQPSLWLKSAHSDAEIGLSTFHPQGACADTTLEGQNCIESETGDGRFLKNANHILKNANDILKISNSADVDNLPRDGEFQDSHYVYRDISNTTTSTDSSSASAHDSVVVVFEENGKGKSERVVADYRAHPVSTSTVLPENTPASRETEKAFALPEGTVHPVDTPETQRPLPAAAHPASTVLPEDSLVFPEKLDQSLSEAIKPYLALLDRAVAQDMLDELSAALRLRQIDNPVGYVRGMVARYEAGTFTREHAPAVQARRAALAAKREAELAKTAEESAKANGFDDPANRADIDAARQRAMANFRIRKDGSK